MVCITTISVWQILRHTMTGSLVNDELGSFREKKSGHSRIETILRQFSRDVEERHGNMESGWRNYAHTVCQPAALPISQQPKRTHARKRTHNGYIYIYTVVSFCFTIYKKNPQTLHVCRTHITAKIIKNMRYVPLF